jgi:hypothetical protein
MQLGRFMMSETISLRELERKAWQTSFQDGLLDAYLGLLLLVAGIPELLTGVFSTELRQYAARVALMLLAFVSYWALKRYVTTPRMGRARFGPARKARRARAVVLYGISAVGLALTLFLILAWLGAGSTAEEPWLGVRELFALGLGGWMMIIFAIGSHLMDFSRGYLIGALYALAFGGTILLDEPIILATCGVVTVLLGLVVFWRFLRTHPKPAQLEPGGRHDGATSA